MRNVLLAACLISTACAGTYSADAPMAAPMAASTPMERGRAMDEERGGLETKQQVSDRKLVRTGNLSVSVSVDAWEPFEADLNHWLAEHGGFVSDLSVSRWEGRVGHASMTVRVPATGLDSLVSWTQEKVEVTHLGLRSEDVTAQWIDVGARLTALRQTEGRLLQLVAEDTATLADVLAAERELGRIRGDIERFEQQQRALSDRVQLASLTVDVTVRQPYSSLVARSFGEQAADAWHGSVAALGAVLRGLALLGVASGPWLGMLGLGLAAVTAAVSVVVRRLRAR